jgi:hypothetical protein
MSIPTPPGPSAPEATRARPVWPYLLIVGGVLLLAANLGWLSVGWIGRLLSLWPVALIAVGVDLLTSGATAARSSPSPRSSPWCGPSPASAAAASASTSRIRSMARAPPRWCCAWGSAT